NLVLVVRKQQIDSASVQIDRIAEMLLAHRTALDVPAWSSGCGVARPGPFHIAVFGLPRFPEREVAAVFFFVGVGGLRFASEGAAKLEFALFHARQPSVAGERADFEIN